MVITRAIPNIATWKYSSVAYGVLIAAGLLDLYMSLRMPDVIDRQGAGKIGVAVMAVSIVLVQMVIWWVAMRGANDFMRYIQTIKNTPDGKGMSDIAKALLWLITYIILVPLTTSAADITRQRSYHTILVFLHNHLPIVAMIIAVSYLYRGSRKLVRLTSSPLHRGWLALVLALFAAVAAIFVWHFYQVVPAMFENAQVANFTLTLPTLLFTYVLPQIIAWLVGVLAVFNLWHYSTHVQGNIYRVLFSNLYLGIFLVFVGTFITQLLIASAITLSRFSLGVVTIYAVLLLGIIGYLLIYRGVNRLIKLEAVT